MSTEKRKAIISLRHPIYEKWLPIWKRNETRLVGGDGVIDEALKPFHWEKLAAQSVANTAGLKDNNSSSGLGGSTQTHFDARKDLAVYINFPNRVAQTMIGSIDRKAPKPDEGIKFGKMGDVKKQGSIAHEVFHSFNKRTGDGVDMISFFSIACRNAMATGHRWIYVESYPRQADIPGNPTEAQMKAKRLYPYAIEYSPINVPLWGYDDAGLAYVMFMFNETKISLTDNSATLKDTQMYYLHVRQGFTALDEASSDLGRLFSAGTYTVIDERGIVDEARSGIYKNTGGQIPAVPLFYEESEGSPELKAISRPGLSEVARLAGSYLNLSSAGDNDALESGSRLLFLLGTNKDEHNQVVEQLMLGGRVVSVPKSDPEADVPELVDIARTTAHTAIEARLNRRLQEMETLAADETRLAPEASGISKENQYRDSKSPRLAMIARNRARCETAVLEFMELRSTSTTTPTASSTWPSDYDLRPILDALKEVINIVAESGASSATLTGLVVDRALAEVGLTDMLDGSVDPRIKDILDEIRASIESSAQRSDFVRNGPGVGPPAAGPAPELEIDPEVAAAGQA